MEKKMFIAGVYHLLTRTEMYEAYNETRNAFLVDGWPSLWYAMSLGFVCFDSF